jgi:hypothetical protein
MEEAAFDNWGLQIYIAVYYGISDETMATEL